jgi:hypothetical protein
LRGDESPSLNLGSSAGVIVLDCWHH